MRKQYPLVDIFKFVGAIMIIAIHTRFWFDINESFYYLYTNVIVRAVVPVFFIFSSFFLFKKIQGLDQTLSKRKRQRIIFNLFQKTSIRIFLLYLGWSLIHLPQSLVIMESQSMGIKEIIVKFFVVGFFRASWYLVATIFGLAIIYFLTYVIRLNNLFLLFITLLMYSVAVVYGFYQDNLLYDWLFPFFSLAKQYHWNIGLSFFNGTLFLVIGKIIAEKEVFFTKVKSHYYLAGALLSYGLAYLEVSRNMGEFYQPDAYFGLIPVAFFLALYLISVPSTIKVPKIIRRSSTNMYTSHFIIIFFVKEFCSNHGIHLSTVSLFLITLISSLVVSVLLYEYDESHENNRLIKYLS
ncbi:acyltransferase family protein [Vagococcus zengguangii]|uniref:acyltransferase family protein n=1 Tax=Vagococcus zengguangii TaxID=2571750 RepID=UPI001108D9AA|nr:acyltransferase family protein [Vagococcus zengguangii]TLG80919.1 acyltransferase [Vagococcus zengguangii]